MITLRNYTGEDINVSGTGYVTYPSLGKVWVEPVKDSKSYHTCDTGETITIKTLVTGTIRGLPPKSPDVLCIVRQAILLENSHASLQDYRDDLISPDHSHQSAIRNEKDEIIAITGFIKLDKNIT